MTNTQQEHWEALTDHVIQLSQQRKFADAIPIAQEALRIAEMTFGLGHVNVATSLMNLARLFSFEGDYTEAEPLYQRAVAIWEKGIVLDHPDLLAALGDLAGLYKRQDRYAEAEPVIKRILAIREKAVGPDAPDLTQSLQSLANLYKCQGKYAEAEPVIKRILAIDEKALGLDHAQVALDLNNLAEMLRAQGRYVDAEPLCRRALTTLEQAVGPDDPRVALLLSNLGFLCHQQGKYAEADLLYRRSLSSIEKALSPNHPDVAQVLNNLGGLYDDRGMFAEAELLFKRALAIREKALGAFHLDVSQTLNNLSNLYTKQGKDAEAESLLRRALAIREKVLGPDHPDTARLVGNLAGLYEYKGEFAEAQGFYKRALAIREKALGPNHVDVANSLGALASHYRYQGKYAEAEPLYNQALAIDERALGRDHPVVASDLNHLAELYREQGKYAEAEPLYKRALAVLENVFGPDHPDVANPLNNLAVLYEHQGEYAQAQPLFDRALAIREKALGPNHLDVAKTLNNLAALYQDQEKYSKAEPLYKRSLSIVQKTLGPDHPDVANPLNNLAYLYKDEGKYVEAESLYKQALAIVEKALRSVHPMAVKTLTGLAILHWLRQDPSGAEAYFERSHAVLSKLFEEQFAYMSEKERLGYLATVAYLFPTYLSFCYSHRDQHPVLVGRMHDLLLWQKGMVVSSMATQRAKLLASGDTQALALGDQLAFKKNLLAAQMRAIPPDLKQWQVIVDQLRQESNVLEKELARRSAIFGEAGNLLRPNWQQVRGALKKNEAAVEYARFRFFDGLHFTDKIYYASLVVLPAPAPPEPIVSGETNKQRDTPVLVFLGESKELEGEPMDDYRQRIAEGPPPSRGVGVGFYRAFWKPLEPELADATRVYVSPDGVLNQVSWVAVPTESDGLLVERFSVNSVLSTKDILRKRSIPPKESAVLIGDPKFDLSESQQRAAVAALRARESPGRPETSLERASADEARSLVTAGLRGPRSRDDHGEPLDPLGETNKEVKSIGSLLRKNGWQVETYVRESALEEVIKRVKSPRVLHVATHGFFEPNQNWKHSDVTSNLSTGLENPMLRAGLYFAGADRGRAGGHTVAGLEDGVLTAYEATGLNLQGTELVVLSACETGLGKVMNGEGVFGLRRAMQEAGADGVLMSMWSVPDEETRQLMMAFYEKWLLGKDKYEALQEAQLELRRDVQARLGDDRPFYWAAFALVSH